jgi:hypothetical protein
VVLLEEVVVLLGLDLCHLKLQEIKIASKIGNVILAELQKV